MGLSGDLTADRAEGPTACQASMTGSVDGLPRGVSTDLDKSARHVSKAEESMVGESVGVARKTASKRTFEEAACAMAKTS